MKLMKYYVSLLNESSWDFPREASFENGLLDLTRAKKYEIKEGMDEEL